MALEECVYPPVQEHWIAAVRFGALNVHPKIYQSYCDLYAKAALMVQRMENVLDNPEHHQVMVMGPLLGFKMPDEDAVRARTYELKACLLSYGPDEIIGMTVGGNVRIPASTVQGFHMTALLTARLVDDVIDRIRPSGYLPFFGYLKDMHMPYQGPTSLQEVIDSWGALINSALSQKAYAPAERLPANWVKCLKDSEKSKPQFNLSLA